VLLALRLHGRTRLGLVAATVAIAGGLGVGWALDGVTGLAVGAAVGAVIATGALGVLAAPVLPSGTTGDLLRSGAVAAILLGVLLMAAPIPLLWLACAAAGGLLALRPDLVRRRAVR
jgi:hypothetical protein